LKEKSQPEGNLDIKGDFFSFSISPEDSAIILKLRDEMSALERCLAYSQSPEERGIWRDAFRQALTKHNIELERILKQHSPKNFVQAVNVVTGVDWMKDCVFTWGRMRE